MTALEGCRHVNNITILDQYGRLQGGSYSTTKLVYAHCYHSHTAFSRCTETTLPFKPCSACGQEDRAASCYEYNATRAYFFSIKEVHDTRYDWIEETVEQYLVVFKNLSSSMGPLLPQRTLENAWTYFLSWLLRFYLFSPIQDDRFSSAMSSIEH